jgi:UDP-N-acetylglucosamine 2-epimerase (non-hydrolysing)/GDP/UDP-N,N'-diacetylbacillosamine 2-epimerase (hydrolysing)
MRTIAVVTVARSDYGIQRPVIDAIHRDPDLSLRLMVSGMHLAPQFGLSVRTIEADGFPIADRIDMLLSSDAPVAIATSMGLGTIGFAQAFARSRPDVLVAAGDRFELHAAVTAALPFNIPIAHVHGGESTEGLIDEAIRHSITKMSHLHFVSTEAYADRVRQMGEEAWRVVVSGAPSLDNLHALPRLTKAELAQRLGVRFDRPLLLATFHPVTLEYERTPAHIASLLDALESVDAEILFTYPNADTGGRVIIDAIERFVATHPNARARADLGSVVYLSLLPHVAAMVGNSSSGIIEAASFRMPVVNIGRRQQGRSCSANVIHVEPERDAIARALATAMSASFRSRLVTLVNPYGDGHAAARIMDTLKQVPLDDRLMVKRFADAR